MIFGYHPSNPNLAGIFGGGGMITMLNISRWILISCGYTGIIKRTDLFKDMIGVMVKGCNKIDRSAMTLITGTVFSGLFCSQSVAILMNAMMLRDAYPKTGGNDQELALDIENLTVLSATWVPWRALGTTINMDGAAIYLGLAAVFVAQIYGIDQIGRAHV